MITFQIYTNQKLIDIFNYAAAAHRNQFRADGVTPYIKHPEMVARTLEIYGIRDYSVLATALCHDILEDTAITYDELKAKVGSVVADAVKELTTFSYQESKLIGFKKPSFTEKNLKLIDKAKDYSDIAKLVKLSDRYCNVQDSVHAFSKKKIHDYAEVGMMLVLNMSPIPEEGLNFRNDVYKYLVSVRDSHIS